MHFIKNQIGRKREKNEGWKMDLCREFETLNVKSDKTVRSVATHQALDTWSRRWRINRDPGPRRFCHLARCRRNLWSTRRRSRNKNRPTYSSLPIRRIKWLRPKYTWNVSRRNDTVIPDMTRDSPYFKNW